MIYPQMLASALIHPGLLWAGVGAMALPIIIHLLSRRRYVRLPWAAMDYLLAALRKNRRRLQMERWLLLAVRCLVLGLCGLALSRPMGCADSQAGQLLAQRSGLHVLVINTSASMLYRASNRSHMRAAQNLAVGLIERMRPGQDAVVIIAAGAPARAIIAEPTLDLAAAAAAVRQLQAGYGGGDLPEALRQALRIARSADTYGKRTCHLITDASAVAWQLPGEPLKDLGRQLAGVCRLEHYDVSEPGQWNRAVVALPPPRDGLMGRFGGELTADGLFQGRDPLPLRWTLDDRAVEGAARVSERAGESRWAWRAAPGAGAHVVAVAVAEADPMEWDNVRRRALWVEAALNVLLVEGDRAARPLEGSAGFLSLALAPRPGEQGDLRPEVISDLELATRSLSEQRAVALVNVAGVAEAQADQLAAYVKGGGALLIFAGPRVDGQAYNAVLGPRGLLPGKLSRVVSAGPEQPGFGFDFNPQGEIHPLLKVFAGEQKSGLDTARIFSYWRLEMPPTATARRVLNYRAAAATSEPAKPAAVEGSDADPAITISELGAGRVIFVSTSADAQWTSLPAKPAYVPLMQELFRGAMGRRDQWLNLEVGQSLQLPGWLKLPAAPLLSGPNRKPAPLPSVGASGTENWQSEPLTEPGVYTLTSAQQSWPIVVNAPAAQSDVRTLDGPALRQALGGVAIELHDDKLPSSIAEFESAAGDWSWSLLLAALGLVGIESLLAQRWGHHSVAATDERS